MTIVDGNVASQLRYLLNESTLHNEKFQAIFQKGYNTTWQVLHGGLTILISYGMVSFHLHLKIIRYYKVHNEIDRIAGQTSIAAKNKPTKTTEPCQLEIERAGDNSTSTVALFRL
jgi:hypothetical protein